MSNKLWLAAILAGLGFLWIKNKASASSDTESGSETEDTTESGTETEDTTESETETEDTTESETETETEDETEILIETGTLNLSVNPSGSTVLVNGTEVSAGEIEIAAGTYEWSASLDGYVTASGTVTITIGETTNLDIALSEETDTDTDDELPEVEVTGSGVLSAAIKDDYLWLYLAWGFTSSVTIDSINVKVGGPMDNENSVVTNSSSQVFSGFSRSQKGWVQTIPVQDWMESKGMYVTVQLLNSDTVVTSYSAYFNFGEDVYSFPDNYAAYIMGGHLWIKSGYTNGTLVATYYEPNQEAYGTTLTATLSSDDTDGWYDLGEINRDTLERSLVTYVNANLMKVEHRYWKSGAVDVTRDIFGWYRFINPNTGKNSGEDGAVGVVSSEPSTTELATGTAECTNVYAVARTSGASVYAAIHTVLSTKSAIDGIYYSCYDAAGKKVESGTSSGWTAKAGDITTNRILFSFSEIYWTKTWPLAVTVRVSGVTTTWSVADPG